MQSFFEEKHISPSTEECERVNTILEEHKKAFLTWDGENAQCKQFIRWAKSSKQLKVTTFEMPPGTHPFPADYKVEMADVKVHGKMGDDKIYSTNPLIWKKVPRGCAVLILSKQDNSKNIYMWAVRACKKFTGHEDDEQVGDTQLYQVDNGGGEASNVVVTLKENGQAMHLTARNFELEGKKYTFLVIGSKNVHMTLPWSEDIAENPSILQQKLHLFDPSLDSKLSRFTVATQMARCAVASITTPVVDYLANNRLTMCSEFILPSSTGPIDNAKLHDIKEPTFFAFSLVPSTHTEIPGMELCLPPIYAFSLMREWNFRVVSYKCIQVSDILKTKEEIVQMRGIEGSVFYHINSIGVLKLEKSKASDYVVIRAIREKIKQFLGSRKDILSVQELVSVVHQLEEKGISCNVVNGQTIVNLLCVDSPTKKWLECVSNCEFREHMKNYRYDAGIFTVPHELKPEEYDAMNTALIAAIISKIQDRCDVASMKIRQRIDNIDHIPMTVEEKEEWKINGTRFLEWLVKKLRNKDADSAEFLENYSGQFNKFLQEEEA